jgi:hypothetical protein
VISAPQRRRVFLFLCLAAIPAASFGQEAIPSRYWGIGGPFAAAPVLNAPFSADATFTFIRTLDDGTRIEQRARARYYRDSAGRVRAEWVDIGLGEQPQTAGRYTSIWIAPYPEDVQTFVTDPSDQTFRSLPRSVAARIFSGGNAFMIPGGNDTYRYFFDYRDWGTINHVVLGEGRIEGVNTVGQRITITPPDHDEPGLVEERWESPELKVVIYSREADSHAGGYGSVEYRLTNITRAEPALELFVAPGMIAYGANENRDGRGRELITFGPGRCLVGCTPR